MRDRGLFALDPLERCSSHGGRRAVFRCGSRRCRHVCRAADAPRARHGTVVGRVDRVPREFRRRRVLGGSGPRASSSGSGLVRPRWLLSARASHLLPNLYRHGEGLRGRVSHVPSPEPGLGAASRPQRHLGSALCRDAHQCVPRWFRCLRRSSPSRCRASAGSWWASFRRPCGPTGTTRRRSGRRGAARRGRLSATLYFYTVARDVVSTSMRWAGR